MLLVSMYDKTGDAAAVATVKCNSTAGRQESGDARSAKCSTAHYARGRTSVYSRSKDTTVAICCYERQIGAGVHRVIKACWRMRTQLRMAAMAISLSGVVEALSLLTNSGG